MLAAGVGTRFGETPKLIAPFLGKRMLQHALDTLHDARVEPIVVVLGHASGEIRPAIAWRDEIVVVNQNPERGLLRSVLLGLRRLDQLWSLPQRTLIVLGDQPQLERGQIEALLAADADEERPFVVPRYQDGSTGNPAMLESTGRVAAEQFAIHSRKDLDRGLGPMFARFPERVRLVDVPGRNPDIDTTADLQRVETAALVARGYDALGSGYVEWGSRIVDEARPRFVGELTQRLSIGARVLDLGCGSGAMAKDLAATFDVTGVDVSAVQLAVARREIPKAKFIQGDMASIRFPAASFDAVAALYSIIHVPRDLHPGLFRNVAHWLRPGGLFLAALSARDDPPWTGEWLGQPMFFSGFDAETNRRLLAEAGFEMLIDEEVELQEPEGPARFQWVLARRPEGQIGTT